MANHRSPLYILASVGDEHGTAVSAAIIAINHLKHRLIRRTSIEAPHQHGAHIISIKQQHAPNIFLRIDALRGRGVAAASR